MSPRAENGLSAATSCPHMVLAGTGRGQAWQNSLTWALAAAPASVARAGFCQSSRFPPGFIFHSLSRGAGRCARTPKRKWLALFGACRLEPDVPAASLGLLPPSERLGRTGYGKGTAPRDLACWRTASRPPSREPRADVIKHKRTQRNRPQGRPTLALSFGTGK